WVERLGSRAPAQQPRQQLLDRVDAIGHDCASIVRGNLKLNTVVLALAHPANHVRREANARQKWFAQRWNDRTRSKGLVEQPPGVDAVKSKGTFALAQLAERRQIPCLAAKG